MLCPRCGASIEGTPSYCPNCGAPLATVAAAAATLPAAGFAGALPESGVVYAGFWRRCGAMILDGVLLNVVTFPMGMMAMIPMTSRMEAMRDSDFSPEQFASFMGLYFMIAGCGLLIAWLYSALMLASKRQATVGMMAIGLIATDVQGRPLSFARATGRYFATLVTSCTLGIGYLVMLFNQRRQTVHDLIAGTVIVRKPNA